MDCIQNFIFGSAIVILALTIKTGSSVCYGVQCLNGGILMTDTGTCICQCPAGYDGIFCEYALRDSVWPDGPYLLPRTKHGCPEPLQFGWKEGYINVTATVPLHMFVLPIPEDDLVYNVNNRYDGRDIIGPFGKYSFQLNFCMKNKNTNNHSTWSDSSDNKWPTGNYSVYSAGMDCPKGCEKHNFTTTLPKLIKWNSDGAQPSFERTQTNDENNEMVFTLCKHSQENKDHTPPMNSHFIFIKHQSEDCPNYDGFITSVENFYIPKNATAHDNVTSSVDTLDGMRFCSYKPEIKDSTVKQLPYFGADLLMGCMVLTGYDIVINDFYREDLQTIISNKNKALHDISTKSIAMCYAWTDAEKSRLSDNTTTVTEREVCEEYPDHFWTGDMIEPYPGCESCKCCQMPGCFHGLASNYRGTWSTTHEGITCQRWDSNVPHVPRQKPEDKAHNHCREIENDSTYPWCYTTDPNHRFQLCKIPKCIQKEQECYTWTPQDYELFARGLEWQAVCELNQNHIWTLGRTDIPTGCLGCSCCKAKGCYNKSPSNYNGTWSTTITESKCARWDSPLLQNMNYTSYWPADESTFEQHNYCRGVGKQNGQLMCYTAGENPKIQACSIPECPENTREDNVDHHACYVLSTNEQELLRKDKAITEKDICKRHGHTWTKENQSPYTECNTCACCQRKDCYMDIPRNYGGTWSTTISGVPCQRWDSQYPHTHNYNKTVYFPNDGYDVHNANNYCRDPYEDDYGYSEYIWCYTNSTSVRWERCGIQECDNGLQTIKDVFSSPAPWILFDLGRTAKVSSVRVTVQKAYTYRGQHLPGLELFYEGDFPDMYISNYKWSFLNDGADVCESMIYFVYLYDSGIYQHKLIRTISGRYFTIYGSKFQQNIKIMAYMLRIQSVMLYTINSGEETMKAGNKDMGLINGGIEDFQISASSSRSGHTPSMTRLYDNQGWCAGNDDISPYIQIDLLLPTIIEGIKVANWGLMLQKADQNTFGITSVAMGCKSFLILHGNVVSELKIYSEQEIQMDVSLPYAVPQEFIIMKPFVSRYVRLQPEKLNGQSFACMKIEIIGCKKYGYPSMTCTTDPTTELTQMNSTYTSVDEPITKSAVLLLDSCEAMCTDNVSECSTIEYLYKTRTCKIYRPSKRKRYPISLTKRESTTVSSNICWKDAVEIDSVTVNYQSVKYSRSASIDVTEPTSITSFGYPFHYDSNIVTRWNISFKEGKYIRLLFSLIDLNIKKDQFSLCKDMLLITEFETFVPYFDDTTEASTNIYIDSRYNGLTPKFGTSVSQIYIIFSSCIFTFADLKYVGRGFRAIVLKDDIATCTSNRNRHYCEQLHMILASHSYNGLSMLNGEYEYWTIKGRVIELTLHEFNVACSSGSQFEIHKQTDGDVVKQRYCNENKPVGDITAIDTLTIQFYFNAGPNLIAVDGFRASYRIIQMENHKTLRKLMPRTAPSTADSVWVSVCSEKFNKCYTILYTHGAPYLPMVQHRSTSCRLNGGNLVTIHSRKENTYVRELLEMLPDSYRPDGGIFDLGLSRHYTNGKVEEIWEDGSPVTFTAWDFLEPSNEVDNICVYMDLNRPNEPNTWRTHRCIRHGYNWLFMCERPLHNEQYYNYEDLVKSDDTTTEVNDTMLNRCNSGEWISVLAQCNGIRECVDSSDEQNCDKPEIDTSFSDMFCTDDMFRCNNGECVHISHVCDFISHCADGSDEYCEFLDCKPTELRCRNHQCVPKLCRCNGKAECRDGSDEHDCGKSCDSSTSFPCDNGICLPLSNKCDNNKDCPDGSDEVSCDERPFTSCLDWWLAGYRITGEYTIDYESSKLQQGTHNKKQVRVRCIFDDIYTENQITLQIPHIDISIEDKDRKTNLKYNYEFLNKYSEKNKCTLQFQQTCSPSLLQVATIDGISERSYNQCACVAYTFNFPKTGSKDEGSVKPCSDQYKVEFTPMTIYKFKNIYDTSDKYVESQDTLEYRTSFRNPLIECIEEFNAVKDTFVCEKEHKVIPFSRKCLYDTDQQGCKSLENLQNCGDSVCPSGYVKCPSSFCLPLQYVCDGLPQCEGGEDEKQCWCDISDHEIAVVFHISDDNEFNSQVRNFAIQFENKMTTIRIVGVSIKDTGIEFEKKVMISVQTINRSLNDIYSKDEVTQTRLYPFTQPTMINATTVTWLSVLNDLFSNATVNKSVIFLHNDQIYPVFNDILLEHDLNISFYHTFVNSSLTSLAKIGHDALTITVRSWNVIGDVGSVLFPTLCTNQKTSICENEFRCAGTRSCISLKHVCDGTLHCYHGDDEAVCNFTCLPVCQCHGYNVNCSNARNLGFLKINNLSPFTRSLDISHNPLKTITITPFNMHLLMRLNMSFCELEKIPDRIFDKTRNLLNLDLQYNNLEVIQKNIFRHLTRLKRLLLIGNTNIYSIEPGAFFGLVNIHNIALVDIKLQVLKANTFEGLNLTELDLTGSTFGRIDDFAFKNLIVNLIYLNNSVIRGFSQDMFTDVLSLKTIIAPAYKFCCLRPSSVAEEQCLPYKDEFSSCEDLMRNNILQTLLWVIGISALVGNCLALVYRLKFDTKRLKIAYGIFVTNLTVADFLMGVYLIIIAMADQMFRNRYIWNDDYWRNSVWCTMAGVLSTLSSETSILFLCLITLDRILVIKFPFGQIRFGTKRALVFSALTWIIGASIAIIPVLYTDYFTTNFYSKSGVCLALPLTRDRPPGWLYSILIFIGLNMLTFLLITVGQLLIFSEVRKSTRNIKQSASKRRTDLVVARNLLLVVTTDFMCWVPIGIMGIMSLNGHVISGDVYAWAAVMLLPINSAINPFLYTLPAIFGKQKFNPSLNEQTRTQTIKTARVDILSVVTLFYQNPENKETRYLTIREALTRGPLKLEVTIKLFRQMMYALYILHKYDLTINQLNDQAILLSLDDTGIIKGRIRLRDMPTTTYYDDVKAKAQNIHNAGKIMQIVLLHTSNF